MCMRWFIIYIQGYGRVNTYQDLVGQMWYMNMREVVMMFGGGRASGRHGPFLFDMLPVKFLMRWNI